MNIMLYLGGADQGCGGDVLACHAGVVLVEGRHGCELLMRVSEEHVSPVF